MFQKAKKSVNKLRIALAGTAGSGKTFSALRLAKGIGGKTAVICTERGSAALYADKFEFDINVLTPPYSPDKYIEAIREAEAAGYEILIIDSFSHAWAGTGGILDIHNDFEKAVKSSFTAWRKVTPIHNKLVDAVLDFGGHIIATLRAKAEYAVSDGTDGQKKGSVKKIGMAPIQREGVDYEFTLVFDISAEHVALASKDRTSIFDGRYIKIDEATGQILKGWLTNDAPLSTPKNTTTNAETTAAEKKPEPKRTWNLIEVMAVIKNELKAEVGRAQIVRSEIVRYFNEYAGDQVKILEAWKALPTKEPQKKEPDAAKQPDQKEAA